PGPPPLPRPPGLVGQLRGGNPLSPTWIERREARLYSATGGVPKVTSIGASGPDSAREIARTLATWVGSTTTLVSRASMPTLLSRRQFDPSVILSISESSSAEV